MKKIDEDLGGTTPLNIILKFPKKSELDNSKEQDEFDEWEEEDESNKDKAKYWFTRDKMDKIIKVHDYLDSLPEIGKVLSFGSILRVAEELNNKELQSLEIAVLYSKIPSSIKSEIISPYISVEKDEARINVRIKDSLKDLRRNDLINKINSDLNTEVGLAKDEYRCGDLLIRFNIIFPDSLSKERKHYLNKILPVVSHEVTFSKKHEIKILENVGERINMEEVNLDEQNMDEGSGVECVQQ